MTLAALAQVLPEAIQLKSVETLPVDFGARPAGSVLSVGPLRCAAHGALLSDDCCCWQRIWASSSASTPTATEW